MLDTVAAHARSIQRGLSATLHGTKFEEFGDTFERLPRQRLTHGLSKQEADCMAACTPFLVVSKSGVGHRIAIKADTQLGRRSL